jgi:hypothetical protein
MSLEIVGSGFGRTGTLSLKLALEQLGFGRCYHMLEVAPAGHGPRWHAAQRGEPVDWDDLFAGFRATVDWPSAAFWRALADHYPRARVIHTERPADAWYDSVRNTIYRVMTGPQPPEMPAPFREQLAMATDLILKGTFGGRFEDRAHAIAVFEQHNARVKREIAPERLLVCRPGDGWDPLCKFLGVPVPSQPYPKVNTTEDFLERLRARR